MIRQHANGRYYCDGRYCGYPLMFCEGDPDEGEPGAWVCLDCNASMYAPRTAAEPDAKVQAGEP